MIISFLVIVTDNATDQICETRKFESADAAQACWRDISNDLYMKGLEIDFSVSVFRAVDALSLK